MYKSICLLFIVAFIFDISCTNDSVSSQNNAPSFINESSSMTNFAIVGEEYCDTLNAIDPDGDILIFSLLSSIAGMELSDSIIIWIPQISDTGIHQIVALVSDNNDGVDTLKWTISVVPLNVGLIAYYPFNGNANDESGNGNNATIGGAKLVEDRFGNINSAYSFDGINDYIKDEVDSTFSVKNITLSVWIALRGTGTDNPRIIGVGPQGTSHQYYSLLMEGSEYSRKLIFMTDYYGDEIEYPSVKELNSNEQWQHIVATYEQNQICIYINGMLDATYETESELMQFVSTAVLQIGHSDDSPFITDLFEGVIDDVRIYNRVLKIDEVVALYEEGGLDWKKTSDIVAPVITIPGDNPLTIPVGESWVEPSVTANDYVDGDLSNNIVKSDSTVNPYIMGNYHIIYTVYDAAGNSAKDTLVVFVKNAMEIGLVAYYSFSGDAIDSSGNGNHGTVNGATLTEDSYNNPDNAYSFDGVDDCIVIPPLWMSSPEEITIKLLFYSRNIDPEDPLAIFYHGDYGEVQLDVYSNMLRMAVKLDGMAWYTTSVTIQANKWYSVIGTWEKGKHVKLYLDNELKDSLSVPNLLLGNAINNPPRIGSRSDWGQSSYFFNGIIDNVYIYNRAFSETEIRAYY